MTNHLTQAAAKRCADLANAEAEARGHNGEWQAHVFLNPEYGSMEIAFRRYVETIDARDREVLALLDECVGYHKDGVRIGLFVNKLRDDLLPEPEPDVLAEAIQAVWNYATGCEHMPPERARQLRAELAKRGVEVKP
jgi:hypothetical protein